MKGFISYIFIYLLTCFSLNAQIARFSQITSEDGISQNEVYCFLHDEQGFIWFGTVDGLNKYDGYEITTFNTEKNNPNALSNNTIRALAEDEYGRIWIGTDDGLNVYDSKKEKIHQIHIKNNEDNLLNINSILVIGDKLFLATSQGLMMASIGNTDIKSISKKIELVLLEFPLIKNNSALKSIVKSKFGGFWIVTFKNAFRVTISLEKNEAILIDNIDMKGVGGLNSIVEDKYDNIWIGTEKLGLIRYNNTNKKIVFFRHNKNPNSISSNKCSVLALDSSDNLWVGTEDKGINVINNELLNEEDINFSKIAQDPLVSNNLNSNLIYSLYQSRDGLMWIGTIGSGVNIYNPEEKEFSHYKLNSSVSDIPISNFIRSVYVDKKNVIWIGTHNNGLFTLSRKDGKLKKLGFDTETIFNITPVNNQRYLICTGSGLSLIRVTDQKIHELSSIKGAPCFDITKTGNDIFWMASLNGLKRIRIVNNKIIEDKKYTIKSSPKLSINNCRVLFYNKEHDELFIGTEGGGLNVGKLNDDYYIEKIKVYKKKIDSVSLSNNYIRSLLKDNSGNVWVGTFEGLNKVSRDSILPELRFLSFNKKNGLPNNMIQSIMEDDNNNLWIGTNGGLVRASIDMNNITVFTKSEGLQSNEFSENTVFKKTDGELIFGGINGINTFYPKAINFSDQKPKTTITNLYLFNKKVELFGDYEGSVILDKSINFKDRITLLSDQNSLGFDFTAMIYNNPYKIKYKYMLEGFEKGWNVTSASNRNANYTNLKYGDYIFKVLSTNEDGIWESEPKQIIISIATPFYFTWYAYLFYCILIFSIFLFFRSYSVIQYKIKDRLMLENEHNLKLMELDELRTKFFINISHDLRTPLTLISEPVNSILKAKTLTEDLKRKLELVKKNTNHLSKLVEQLLDFRKAESGHLIPHLSNLDLVEFTRSKLSHFSYSLEEKNIHVNISSSNKKIITNFDPEIISKIYFNLISNAIDYTENGHINITIERIHKSDNQATQNSSVENFVKIDIQDNGKGISEENQRKIFDRFYQDESKTGKGYGIGLSHTKDLITAHSGYIGVSSVLDQGTTIIFFIPDKCSNKIDERTTEKIKSSKSENNEQVEELSITTFENENKPIILIIDDNPDLRTYIRYELENEYSIIEAIDGEDGLKKALDNIPDLIISDLMMPKMDGMALCKEVKSNIKTSHIPVILLTAKSGVVSKHAGIESGADDYFSKPFSVEYLLIRIKNLLKSREKLRELFKQNLDFKPSSISINSIDEIFLNSLMLQVEKGIPDPEFTVTSLEKIMAMSHANFYRKIKSLTGQSGKGFLQEMRMKRAYQILKENSNIRISEVSYMTGFTDPRYFSRCFKSRFGVLPSEIKS